MGSTELPGSVVMVTYFPAREEQPGRFRVNFVSSGLAAAYRNNLTRGFDSTVQIEEDGKTIYEDKTLRLALERIASLVNENRLSVEEAAKRIATEDGYF